MICQDYFILNKSNEPDFFTLIATGIAANTNQSKIKYGQET